MCQCMKIHALEKFMSGLENSCADFNIIHADAQFHAEQNFDFLDVWTTCYVFEWPTPNFLGVSTFQHFEIIAI